jgi:hypothetical protein
MEIFVWKVLAIWMALVFSLHLVIQPPKVAGRGVIARLSGILLLVLLIILGRCGCDALDLLR